MSGLLISPPPPDQASRLRAICTAVPPTTAPSGRCPTERAAPPPRTARVIAVSSGKGGVGKTNTCVNLSIALARLGRRVSLLDADLGMANADVLCGLMPARRLDALLRESRRPITLAELAVDAPGGFRLVPGAVGVERMADLGPADRARLLAALGELERDSDLVVVDTGAGISRGVTCFLRAADLSVVVATPDPTSITDAYALVKCVVGGAAPGDTAPGGTTPGGAALQSGGATPHVVLVVNQADSEREARSVHARIAAVTQRFLSYRLPLLGWVAQDVRVIAAVRKRAPVMLESPRCQASRDLRDLALSVMREVRPAQGSLRPVVQRPGLSGLFSRLFLREG
ncbi:MAG: MinD/ParA family protein [Phycisphaerales bacterium]|nr:MinD/ParA family protein [Phycisphaerales bacterium]